MSQDSEASLLSQRLQQLALGLAERELPDALSLEMSTTLARWERALADAANGAGTPTQGVNSPAQGDLPLELEAGTGAAADSGVIQIWCDGSCAPNPGPGGWGALVERDGVRSELSGASPQSTNNIMEMTAAIEAVRTTPKGAHVVVTTDSRYLLDGITRWIAGWKKRGWRKADGDKVLNMELWKELDALVRPRQVRWEWVRGHQGHPENERCDALANEARLTQNG